LTTASTDRRDLQGVRIYYLIWFGAAGSLFPFINLFYVQQGLSGTEIGWLYTIASITALIAAPWWGHRIDRAARPQRLAQLALLGSIVCMLILSQQKMFVWLALIVGVEAAISAGVGPLSDMLALNVTHGNEKSGYGSVRLWGSLGWAIFVFIAGLLIEQLGLQVAFIGYAVMMLGSVLIINALRYRASPSDEKMLVDVKVSLVDEWRELLRERALLGLAIALSIVWFATNGLRQFEPVYMKTLGAGESVIGLASTIGALPELLAMLWADRLVKRHGAGKILQLSFVLDVIRFIGVLIVPSVPAILISRGISGLSYSFYVVALTVFIRDHSRVGRVTMMLAVLTVTLPSFINMLAGPAGGWFFDQFGAYWLYAISAVGTVLAWIAMQWGSMTYRQNADNP
jgi:PPP family 3-phenylpropionic acid transporter